MSCGVECSVKQELCGRKELYYLRGVVSLQWVCQGSDTVGNKGGGVLLRQIQGQARVCGLKKNARHGRGQISVSC